MKKLGKYLDERSLPRLGVLLCFSAVFMLFASPYTTPLNAYYGYDSAVFMSFGKGITHGLRLYLDLYDNKGPMIFYFNALGYLLGGRMGLWILQVVFMTFAFELSYRTARLFTGRGTAWLSVLVPFVQKTFSLSSGACLLTAILVLTVMILPYIVSVSETALRAVPREYEEASLALGATKAETWFLVSLRAAKSGVIASVIQGTGRAVGEAMAILMVAGNVANMPSLFASVRFLTTAIVSEMSYAAYGSLQRDALFSVGLVLFLFILLINAALRLLGERSAKA